LLGVLFRMRKLELQNAGLKYSSPEFAQEMLDGQDTAAINFDRLQYHPQAGDILFEYLKCEEEQDKRGITPYTSHPNKYWYKDKRKFLALWRVAQDLPATLFLVNYAEAGTRHADEILLIRVKDVTADGLKGDNRRFTRSEFQAWFQELNKACLGSL